ncbi:hypothetical protein N8198_09880, partial [Gammaproteobacteria bacterium]|nr:hypothetical protein [Gammaproteobacteria bacterium]
RRWDYVGTGLGLDRSNMGVEFCTGQISRVFSSHSNYWGDELVVEKFKTGLNKAFPVPCSDRVDFDYEIPTPVENGIQLRLAQIVQKFSIVLVVIVIVIAFSNFYQSRKAWVDSIDQETAQLQQQGIVTSAQVTYRRTLEGSGEDSYYLHHFNFTLPETGTSIPEIEIPDNVIYDKNARRFDYQALARFVLQDCIPAEEKKWWQILKSKKSIPCTRSGIPIRLDADDPGSFWLPDFPARRTWGGIMVEIFGSLVLAIFFALGCFILIPVGGVALFRLFLGLKPEA